MREKGKKEENQGGTKERLQHRKEVKRIHKMIAEGSPRRTVVSGPEEQLSRLEKRSQGSQKEVLRRTDYHVERLGTLLKVGDSYIQSQADGKKQANY